MNTFAQNSIYIAPSIGPIINKSVEKPMEFIGYTIEAGYLHDNEISAGSHTVPLTCGTITCSYRVGLTGSS